MQNHSYENDFDLHGNKTAWRTLFHMKGFALRHVLKQRHRRTQKWPINEIIKCQLLNYSWSGFWGSGRYSRCTIEKVTLQVVSVPTVYITMESRRGSIWAFCLHLREMSGIIWVRCHLLFLNVLWQVFKQVIYVVRKILSREMKDYMYNKFTHISSTMDIHSVCWDFGWGCINDQSVNRMR